MDGLIKEIPAEEYGDTDLEADHANSKANAATKAFYFVLYFLYMPFEGLFVLNLIPGY